MVPFFIDNTQRKDVKHALRESVEWNDPTPEIPKRDEYDDNWRRVCDLMHSECDSSSGIAAFHIHCYDNKLPTIMSAHDPNQGWGDDDEGEENYFGSIEQEGHEYPPPQPIEGYDVHKEVRKEFLRTKLWQMEQDLQTEQMMKSLGSVRNNKGVEGIIDSKIRQLENKINDYKKEMEELTCQSLKLGTKY